MRSGVRGSGYPSKSRTRRAAGMPSHWVGITDPGKADERTCRESRHHAIGDARQLVGDLFPRQASRGALLGGAAPSAERSSAHFRAVRRRCHARQGFVRRNRRGRGAGLDGSLAAARRRQGYAHMAKTENTRRASPLPQLRRRRGGRPRERTWPRSHPRTLKLRRRLTHSHGRRRGLRDPGRHPAPRGPLGLYPRKKVATTDDILRQISRQFAATSGACIIGRCFWLASRGLCADPNSPAFALSNWSKRNVGSASPCRRPRGRRPLPSWSPALRKN